MSRCAAVTPLPFKHTPKPSRACCWYTSVKSWMYRELMIHPRSQAGDFHSGYSCGKYLPVWIALLLACDMVFTVDLAVLQKILCWPHPSICIPDVRSEEDHMEYNRFCILNGSHGLALSCYVRCNNAYSNVSDVPSPVGHE